MAAKGDVQEIVVTQITEQLPLAEYRLRLVFDGRYWIAAISRGNTWVDKATLDRDLGVSRTKALALARDYGLVPV